MNKKNIEVEGNELALRNENGDIIIIPKNKREITLKHLNDGNHTAIDELASNLPYMKDYAEDGTIISPTDPPTGLKGIGKNSTDINNATNNNNKLDQSIDYSRDPIKTYNFGERAYKYNEANDGFGVNYNNLNRNNISPEAFTLNYLNSPKHKERYMNQRKRDINYLLENDYKDTPEDDLMKSSYRKSLNNLDYEYNERLKNWNRNIKNSDVKYYLNGYGTHFNSITHDVSIDLKQLTDPVFNTMVDKFNNHHPDNPVRDALAHEEKHVFDAYNPTTPTVNNDIQSRIRNVKDDHDAMSEETRADIGSFRYQLYLNNIYNTQTEDFTQEHLDKFRNTPKARHFTTDRIQRLFNDKDLIYLMNTLSYQDNNNNEYNMENNTLQS